MKWANSVKAFGTTVGAQIQNISLAFAKGQISSKAYNSSISQISTAFSKLSEEGKKVALTQMFKDVDPEIKKTADKITDLTMRMQYLEIVSLGGSIPENVINGLNSKNERVRARAIAQFNEYKKTAIGSAKEFFKEMGDIVGTGTGSDGGEDSPFVKATKQLAAQIKESYNQIKAFQNLKKAGYETGKAFEIAKDPILAAALATTKVGTKRWKTLIKLINEVEAKAKQVAKLDLEQNFSDSISKVTEAFAAQEERLRLQFEKATSGDKSIVSGAQDKINVLQKESDSWSDALDQIQEKEDEINKSYDTKVQALEKVRTLNEAITRQQQAQLSVADALTQGDISAAAQAMQEYRSQQASAAMDSQQAALEAGRTSALGGLTANGMTRLQIEAKLKDIKSQIKKIEVEELEPAQKRLDLAEKKLEADIAALTVAGKTKLEWDTIANNIRIAQTETDEFVKSLWEAVDAANAFAAALAKQKTVQGLPGPVNTWIAAGIDPVKASQDYVNSKAAFERSGLSAAAYIKAVDRGQTFGFKSAFTASNGGMVPKYFAAGGFAKGTDTVPSMLTPGEFVVKKYAVKDFGVDKLKSINNGTYSGDSVYNYELNVNMSGSNLDANDVARAVMSQIKQIDSQRIRSNRI
jgi:hypothetical protein